MPVSGYTPEVSVDAEGFWTVNGERLNDAEGDPIEANDGESCLFKDIARDANGNLSLTLGDGKIITLPIQQVLNLTLSTAINTTVVDPTVPATIEYELHGEHAAEALGRHRRGRRGRNRPGQETAADHRHLPDRIRRWIHDRNGLRHAGAYGTATGILHQGDERSDRDPNGRRTRAIRRKRQCRNGRTANDRRIDERHRYDEDRVVDSHRQRFVRRHGFGIESRGCGFRRDVRRSGPRAAELQDDRSTHLGQSSLRTVRHPQRRHGTEPRIGCRKRRHGVVHRFGQRNDLDRRHRRRLRRLEDREMHQLSTDDLRRQQLGKQADDHGARRLRLRRRHERGYRFATDRFDKLRCTESGFRVPPTPTVHLDIRSEASPDSRTPPAHRPSPIGSCAA